MAESDTASLVQQAADWIVASGSDDPAERAAARSGYEKWKALHPSHAQAGHRLEQTLGLTRVIQGEDALSRAGQQTLIHALAIKGKRRARRQLGVRAAALLLVVLPVIGLLNYGGGTSLWADLHAGRGQLLIRALEDGSTLSLASASSANIHYSPHERRIELLQGEVRVDVVPDPLRPFIVATDDGEIRALGTKFIVRMHDGRTVVEMLESKVEVRPRLAPDAARVLTATERLSFAATGGFEQTSFEVPGVETAFEKQLFEVRDQALDEVLDELARHQPGLIHFDRQALHALRLSGVLPKNDVAAALGLLRQAFPDLEVHSYVNQRLIHVRLNSESSQ